MTGDIHLVGSSWTPVGDDTPLQLDELVFATCSDALRNAGVRRHQIGLSVTSSLDLYDARSISSALTAPAAAGYLTDELRVEGDAGTALLVAAAGVAAGSVEYAIVVAVHVPEVASTAEADLRRIGEQVSSYTFDSHLDRPVGMTALASLGLHAAARLDAGAVTAAELAHRSASDITRGASRRGVRAAVDAAGVADSPTVTAPLTALMLPAASAAVGAVVLAGGVAGRRCPRPLGRLIGWGQATAPSTADPRWLAQPGEATGRAARAAYARAGLTDPAEQVGTLEMTDLSPAVTPELLAALQLEKLPADRVNPSGGVRSNHPGIANGLLRVIEAGDGLAAGGGTAVVHTTDALCGLVSSTATVLVLEKP
jgi:hypothetical protein